MSKVGGASPAVPDPDAAGPAVADRVGGIGIGLDVGGTKVLGVVVDADGVILGEDRRETPAGGDEILDVLAQLAAELSKLVESDGHRTVGLGVGVPGLVDANGILRFAPNLAGANGMALRTGLVERLPGSWAVAIDNDATCAMAGEQAFGAARGCDEALMVTVGTGIGGGIVSGGRLVRGAHNFAGEIGHVIVDPHGVPCPCGHRGCWERYASGSGLGRLGRDAAGAGRAADLVARAGGDPDAVRGEHVVAAAGDGDPEAQAILAEFAWWLGLGLANLANVLDPEVIVVGGGLAALGEMLLAPTRLAFEDFVERPTERKRLRIVVATLGNRGGAIGAAVNGLIAGRTDGQRADGGP
jgi:glucokinase